jgi:hypothetical protein
LWSLLTVIWALHPIKWRSPATTVRSSAGPLTTYSKSSSRNKATSSRQRQGYVGPPTNRNSGPVSWTHSSTCNGFELLKIIWVEFRHSSFWRKNFSATLCWVYIFEALRILIIERLVFIQGCLRDCGTYFGRRTGRIDIFDGFFRRRIGSYHFRDIRDFIAWCGLMRAVR